MNDMSLRFVRDCKRFMCLLRSELGVGVCDGVTV